MDTGKTTSPSTKMFSRALCQILLLASFFPYIRARSEFGLVRTTASSPSSSSTSSIPSLISSSITSLPFTSCLSKRTITPTNVSPDYFRTALLIRGGSSADSNVDEYDNEEYDDEEEYDEEEYDEEEGEESEVETTSTSKTTESLIAETTQAVLSVLGKAALEAIFAAQRAVDAGMEALNSSQTDIMDGGDTTDYDGSSSSTATTTAAAMDKIRYVLSSMIKAAFRPPPSTDGEESQLHDDTARTSSSSSSSKKARKTTTIPKTTTTTKTASSSVQNLGTVIAKEYGITPPSDDTDTILLQGGSLSKSLQNARAKAHLLVVYLPSSKPKRNQNKSDDAIAFQSLFSSQVSNVANKPPRKRKKQQQEEDEDNSGSFSFWTARFSSVEATSALRRFKVRSNKKPVLLVAYPAQVMDKTTSRPKIVPQLLAQHHCNPPPSPTSAAAWLDALRKRHAKQYASMQHHIRELKLYRERTEGYKTSVLDDRRRLEEEKREIEQKQKEERLERERKERIQVRREGLLQSLPDEPGVGEKDGVVVVALRFADGRTGRRRFWESTQMDTVFDWVDAVFEMEREKVVLTTMNGQKTFSYTGASDDGDNDSEEDGSSSSSSLSLEDAGLGKMVAFRVLERKDEDATGETSSSDDDDDDDDDEE